MRDWVCDRRKFRVLTLRLVGMGLAVGLASGAAIWSNEAAIIALFTTDPHTGGLVSRTHSCSV